MSVDMSPVAVTGRMQMLNQLWELSVALQSSDLANSEPVEREPFIDAADLIQERDESSLVP